MRASGAKRDGDDHAPQPLRMVRMRDVADRAGVGTMTVSRVLNRTAPVSEETTTRVFRAIQELQYQPNQLARALRGSKSHTIGVMVPYLYDTFFAECAHAIGVVAKQHSYSMILTTTHESRETELEEARQMLRRRVDGLLIIPSAKDELELTAPEFQSLPIVTLDRPIAGSGFDSVVVENMAGAQSAVRHLVEHGHRRICYVGLGRNLYTMKLRLEGYKNAMRERGLQPNAHFEGDTQEAMTALLRVLLAGKNAPTALFAANGLTTRFALESLAHLNIRVPDNVALIGFDDFQLADILQPALTVVRQPTQELGRTAAEMLFRRLGPHMQKASPHSVMLPVELVVRRSCGCPPSTPAPVAERTELQV